MNTCLKMFILAALAAVLPVLAYADPSDVEANARYDMIEKTQQLIDKLQSAGIIDAGAEVPQEHEIQESVDVIVDDEQEPVKPQKVAVVPGRKHTQPSPVKKSRKVPVSNVTLDHNEHELGVGTEFSYISYREPDEDVEEKGPFFGFFANYDYRPTELEEAPINVFHMDAHLNFGVVDYSGSGTVDNINDYLFEPRLWIGKDLALGEALELTPYAGFGYRWLHDDFGGKITSTGNWGYDRRSQYIYVPLGAEFKAALGNDWGLGLTAEYDYFLQGRQDSYFSIQDGSPDIQNKQKKGFGVRGSVKLVKKSDRVNWLLEPYVRYWHIKDSQINTATGSVFIITGYEPENTSMEVGSRLGVEF